jgi:hypothetical protein
MSVLTAAQQIALAALLEGAKNTEAAARARVDRKTIYNWLRPGTPFQKAFAQASQAHAEAWAASFNAATRRSLDVMTAILTNTELPPAVRLKAALGVLNRNGGRGWIGPVFPGIAGSSPE